MCYCGLVFVELSSRHDCCDLWVFLTGSAPEGRGDACSGLRPCHSGLEISFGRVQCQDVLESTRHAVRHLEVRFDGPSMVQCGGEGVETCDGMSQKKT